MRTTDDLTTQATDGGLLAELTALQQDNPAAAIERFDALSNEQMRSLSMELGLRLCTSTFADAHARERLLAWPKPAPCKPRILPKAAA